MIYIKEIHPSAGWQVCSNERDGVRLPRPQRMEERIEVRPTRPL